DLAIRFEPRPGCLDGEGEPGRRKTRRLEAPSDPVDGERRRAREDRRARAPAPERSARLRDLDLARRGEALRDEAGGNRRREEDGVGRDAEHRDAGCAHRYGRENVISARTRPEVGSASMRADSTRNPWAAEVEASHCTSGVKATSGAESLRWRSSVAARRAPVGGARVPEASAAMGATLAVASTGMARKRRASS